MYAFAERPAANLSRRISRPLPAGQPYSATSLDRRAPGRSPGTLVNLATQSLFGGARLHRNDDLNDAAILHHASGSSTSPEHTQRPGRAENANPAGSQQNFPMDGSKYHPRSDEFNLHDAPPVSRQTPHPAPAPILTPPAPHPVPAAPRDSRDTDAPTADYILPFDSTPLAAPGERVIFRANLSDPSPDDYQIQYSTTGGHFNSASGPASLTIGGLLSGNVDFFVPAHWDGKTTLSVVLKVVKISDHSVAFTQTWTFGRKVRFPTRMTQKEGTGEVDLPGIYTYDIGPALSTGTKPFYQFETILERFTNWSLNIAPADIVPAYRKAHGLNSAGTIVKHFLGDYVGNNGTFTVDNNDQISDEHGKHPDLSNLVSNLAAPKQVEVRNPQIYEAKPGTALGRYTITRVLKSDGTTWKVKKGPT